MYYGLIWFDDDIKSTTTTLIPTRCGGKGAATGSINIKRTSRIIITATMDDARALQSIVLLDPVASKHEPSGPSPGAQYGTVMNIATISSGFEKGDFLVREEKGQRVYFDFFEEAFNYIAYKGYIRMQGDDEKDWLETMNNVHASVKGGMKYNTGTLLMVLYKPLAAAGERGDYGIDANA
jgi:hypothetical protein